MKTKILIVLLVICLGVVMFLNYNQHRSLVDYQEKLVSLKKEVVNQPKESDQVIESTDNTSLEKIKELEEELAEKEKEITNKSEENNGKATLDDIKKRNDAVLKASFTYDDMDEQKKAVQELSTERYANKLKEYVSDFEKNSLETSEITSKLGNYTTYLGKTSRTTAEVLNVVNVRHKENGISQKYTLYMETHYKKIEGTWLLSDVIYKE